MLSRLFNCIRNGIFKVFANDPLFNYLSMNECSMTILDTCKQNKKSILIPNKEIDQRKSGFQWRQRETVSEKFPKALSPSPYIKFLNVIQTQCKAEFKTAG